MKTVILLSVFLFIAENALAEPPIQFSYQSPSDPMATAFRKMAESLGASNWTLLVVRPS